MRRHIVAFALTSMLMLGLVSVAASAASASTMPAEGVFENCNLATDMATCLARLETMHTGGMNVVVISASGEPLSALSAYADVAHSMGMSVMWEIGNQSWWDEPTSTDMSGYYNAFSQASGLTQNSALLSYVVRWLGSLPGTYGYYAADDSMLAPGDGPAIANYMSQIKAADPSHPAMIGSADQAQTESYQSSADMIGSDIYPVTTSSLMPISDNQGMWDDVGATAAAAQSSASSAGHQSAFILQAFTWGDNLGDGQTIGACTSSDTQASCYAKLQYPSAAAQLQLRNEILTNAHPSLILWWSFMGTYGQEGNDTYSIYPTGAEAAARWAGLSAAIQAPYPTSSAASSQAAQPKASNKTKAPKAYAASKKTKRHTHKRHHKHRRRRKHHTIKHRHGRRFLAHAA